MEHVVCHVCEAELHNRLHRSVEAVVSEKKILLFKEMLEIFQCDDLAVVDLLITGIQVVGTLGKIGIWKPEDRSAKISLATLLKGAQAAQADVVKLRAGGPEDAEVWKATVDEIEEGCLEGPFTADEITQKLGKNWVLKDNH